MHGGFHSGSRYYKQGKKYTRIGLLSLIILAVAAGAGVYYYQHHNNYLTVYDAHVAGKTTAVRTKAAGTITDLKVADGDHVEAGDVIAVIDPGITEEQIQQLEQNLALTKQNLEQLQRGPRLHYQPVPRPSQLSMPVRSSVQPRPMRACSA